jgi:hypothetical protein
MDHTNVLVWNVRGLNEKARRDNVRLIMDSCRPALVCLQESKLASFSIGDVLSLLGQDLRSHVFRPANGTREQFSWPGLRIAWWLSSGGLILILFQSNLTRVLIQHGGSQVSMVCSEMKIKLIF